MKKKITIKIIIALATILLSINTFAQSFYAKLNGGYNWGIASNIISRNSNQVGSVNSYEKVNLSFGKGINFSGAIGYLINKNIGVELGVSYLMGGTTENSSKSSSFSSSSYDNNSFSSTLLNFIPSIIISPGFEKINPYAKIGMSLGIASVTIKSENSSTSGNTTDITNRTFKENGGLAVGLISAIGATYEIDKNISLFGELTIATLSYSPSKSEITEFKENGVDKLSTLKMVDKVTEYTDSYSIDYLLPPDVNNPTKSTPINIPFSSLGINIGVKYIF